MRTEQTIAENVRPGQSIWVDAPITQRGPADRMAVIPVGWHVVEEVDDAGDGRVQLRLAPHHCRVLVYGAWRSPAGYDDYLVGPGRMPPTRRDGPGVPESAAAGWVDPVGPEDQDPPDPIGWRWQPAMDLWPDTPVTVTPPADDPVGSAWVAEYLGVERATVDRMRAPDRNVLPPPDWPVSQTGRPLWRQATIVEWARARRGAS